MEETSETPPDNGDDQPMFDIEQPHSNDVLCGRGVTTNKWAGNEQFRSLVSCNKELYVTSTKRQKMAISRSIVDAVRSMKPPGRFLEKNPETGLWSDVGERKAVEKTSQALRDGAAELRKQLSADLHDPDFLNAVFDMDSTTAEAAPKKKPKPVKSKTVKKGHRRTKSNPDSLSAVRKKALQRKAMRSFDGPCSPRSLGAVRSRYGSLSQPASPLVSRSSGSPYPDGPHNYPLSMMFPMHPEDAYRESIGEAPLFRNNSFDAPPSPMVNTWGPRMSPSRGSYFGLHSHGSFPPPPASPLHSGHPGLSPRGYWHTRPPMSPGRSWSLPGEARRFPPLSPRSPASTTVLMSQRPSTMRFSFPSPFAQRELSVPVLQQHPGSPGSQHEERPLSPRSGVHSPASQRDFTPPMSPISVEGRKRDEPKTIIPNPVESCSNRGKRRERLPPTVAVSNSEDGDNQDVVEWGGDGGFEVILRERSACESPEIMGDEVDKFSLNDDTSQTSPSEESMSPLPYDQEDQTAMMEISEELLQLPIAPVGPDDEGPQPEAPKSS